MSEINELEKLIAGAMLKMSTAGEEELNGLEVSLLGRKGELNRLLAILPSLPTGGGQGFPSFHPASGPAGVSLRSLKCPRLYM